MKRYDSYKDSGVEWIGEIPSHWGVTKHKFNLTILSGFPFKSELFDHYEGFPLIRIRDITTGKLETFYKGEVLPDYVVHKGDLLVGMDGDYNIRWWESDEGLLNQRCCSIIESDKIFRRFLFYILPMELKILNDLTYYTTVKHLSVSDIYNTITILPPLSEQQQIVTFLDIKTLFFDSLIEKTQRKIELLNEKRTSLINEVVTKGLNPNVEMKDSGVEWIGDIPSHWEKSCVRYVTQEHRQGYYSSDSYTDEGLRVVRITDLNDDRTISIENSPFYQLSDLEKERFILKGGDFLFPRTGGVGRFGIFNDSTPSIYGSFLIRFRFSEKVVNQYMRYYFDSGIFLNQILSEIHGGVNQNVHVENIKDCKIFYPKKSEQQQIVSYLDEHTQLIDKTISVEERRIEFLKEYRQSLISEVVTGKINVCQDNGIPWFQKPVPKVTIHKFETPINGREAIIGTIPPIWGEEVYKIVLNNLEVINSLYSSDIQFELIKKYLIPIGTNPQECYLIFKENVIFGIYYSIEYYQSRNEDYVIENEGRFFEILGTEIISTKFDQIPYWVFKELKKKGYTSFFKYYCKQNGLNDGGVMSFIEINEKIKNAKEVF